MNDGSSRARFLLYSGFLFNDNKRLQKPTMGCLFEPLIRKWFSFLETVSSIHGNLQIQLRSVREVFKDLNVMSSSQH